MATRKPKTNTAEAKVKMLASAFNPIKPLPQFKLLDKHLVYWNSIVRARDNSDWNITDLALAASLAKCLCKIDQLTDDLEKGTDTLTNERGTVVANPLHSILETHTRRAVALSRSLQLHALATQGETRNQKAKVTAKKQAEKTVNNFNVDDLFAAPSNIN